METVLELFCGWADEDSPGTVRVLIDLSGKRVYQELADEPCDLFEHLNGDPLGSII